MTNSEIIAIREKYPELKEIEPGTEIDNHFDYKHSPHNTFVIKKSGKIIGWKPSFE